MNTLQIDEIKYCPHCGSANKKSAVVCEECDKKMKTAYTPFYDFLKKHTKDELSDKMKDSFFSVLKNYLKSHIYGVALSVSIVATAVSSVYALEPHIEKVSIAVETCPYGYPIQVVQPLADEEMQSLKHLCTTYDAFVDMLRPSEAYWDTSCSEYSSAEQLYAENNIKGFNYGGVHEMISNPLPMYMVDVDPRFKDVEWEVNKFNSDRYMDVNTLSTGEGCVSEIAKKLSADGYRVAECDYVLFENVGEYDFNTHTGEGFSKYLVYKFVFVEHDGNWYIAEDRLTQSMNM